MDEIKELKKQVIELEQKINRTGQYYLDAVNEQLAELDKKININKDNCVSNNEYKKLWEENTKDYNDLARKRLDDYSKINVLEKKVDDNIILLTDAVRKGFVRMDSTDNNINKIYGLLKSGNIAFKEDYDILEGKYHQLRSELDSIYKVLEMDALDIQDLYEQLENHPNKGENNASK
tara:strand:+ start:66 stop:596 length:531 start_codon:yes stop_codon:yes gene_type:complete